jgi:hypothetical protein
MTVTDRIEVNPRVMLGKPVVRGTKIWGQVLFLDNPAVSIEQFADTIRKPLFRRFPSTLLLGAHLILEPVPNVPVVPIVPIVPQIGMRREATGNSNNRNVQIIPDVPRLTAVPIKTQLRGPMSERKPKGVKCAFSYSQKIYHDVKDPHGQTATDRIPRRVLSRHEPRPISP